MTIENEKSLISDLVESKKKNKEVENKYQHLFNSLGDAIFVHDMNGRILDANEHACQRYGYSKKQFKTMTVKDVDSPDQARFIQQRIETLLKDGQIIFETIHLDCQKKPFPVEATAKLGKYEGKQVVLVIGHEITERKRIEKELLKVQKLESLGVLAGGIAHDFNNILASILGNIELVELETKLTDQTYACLEEAKKASLRAKQLTQQLLTFARGGEPVKHPVSIGTLITNSANFVMHGSSVICKYNIPEDLWQAYIDPGQISQVVHNITLNAVHAMPEGGLIEVSCENYFDHRKELSIPESKYIKIIIADSGIGIPASSIDKIFDPYFSSKQFGSGLGLAICHSIISKHGGHISVKSISNKGTVFTIYLPATKKTVQEVLPSQPAISKTEQKRTIMVMDDEPMVRNMMKRILSHYGHEVLLVENGHQAIALYNEYFINNRLIDLIIMDLTIPGGMGGKDTIPEILKINRDAKVIVASGYSNNSVLANYKDYGFAGSIVKPFQTEELHKLINKVLS
jgi:two-component system, cell cycle sensor histidine kinase and response regulator CckA